MYAYETRFPIGSKVVIDGHTDIVGYVTALMWRHPQAVSVEVSWVHDGRNQAEWVPEWRLELHR